MSEAALKQRLTTIEAATRGGRKPGPASGNGFRRVGLRVPQVRSLVKAGHAVLEGLSAAERLQTWHYIYNNTSLYEVGSQAIYSYQYRTLTKSEATKLSSWINRCDCWEHSDDLSKIYAQVFEENPDWMIGRFEKWNRDRNPWKRRQSVLGLLEYAGKRKCVPSFDELIRFITPLLADEEYYVQKGVGWTLREIGNVYPIETGRYIDERCIEIHPTAWSAATEKLRPSVKKQLNTRRRKARQ